MIYTLGYSKWTVDQVIKTMDEKKIELLVDVRSIPYSRFSPSFNKAALIVALGPRYIWKGKELGGKPGPATEEGIEWLVARHAAGHTLIILCLEFDPRKCHRLTDLGARLYLRGIDAVHLIHDGSQFLTSHYLGPIENLGGTL